MKLTIATPTFGVPVYLRDCIESVNNQILDTKHIVCGGNLIFENSYYTTDIILKDPDPGMVPCWGEAATLANTDYIGFLADDNTFKPDFAEKMTAFLDANPECDLVFCNQCHMDVNGMIDEVKSEALTNFFGRSNLQYGIVDKGIYPHILKYNSIPLEACIIRKSVWLSFGPFKNEAKGAFDMEFLYSLLLKNITIGFIPEYLMNFRWHENSYSSKSKKEHLIGTIWVSEFLKNENLAYQAFFINKVNNLKGSLLRHKLEKSHRNKLLKDLINQKGGIKIIVKNLLGKLLKK